MSKRLTCLESLKVITTTEFSFQNPAALAPSLNLAKPLEAVMLSSLSRWLRGRSAGLRKLGSLMLRGRIGCALLLPTGSSLLGDSPGWSR